MWDQYREGTMRPQYIVFDRDMTIVFKGISDLAKDEAEDLIEDML